jgi:hypothetical protein
MMIPLDRNMLANLWSVLHNKECAFVEYIELLLSKVVPERNVKAHGGRKNFVSSQTNTVIDKLCGRTHS